MRTLFVASGQLAVPPLRWMVNSPHEVVAVVTQPDRRAGRGRRTVPTPVKVRALLEGLPLIQPEDVNDPTIVDQLLSYAADLVVIASFGQMIGPALLEGVPGGWLNIHPSLLPKCRGAAPVNWTIIRGEPATGVTVYRLVEDMDAGPILSVRETMIKPSETAGELYGRLAGIGCDALSAALDGYDHAAPPPGLPQDHDQATFAPKLTKAMGRISLQQPASDVVGWVNGLFPWPGAQLVYVPADGRKATQVRPARAALAEDRPPAGESIGTILGDGSVVCADGAIRLLEIQPAGGQVMSWRDFVNGRRVRPGDRLESVDGSPET